MSRFNTTTLTVIGFLLFLTGMLALVLSLLGIELSLLAWLSSLFGRGGALVAHLAMVIFGIVAIVLSRSDFSGEDPQTKTDVN